MTRVAPTGSNPRRIRSHYPLHLLCACALGFWIPAASAEPTFNPDSPNEELAPGGVLAIQVTPGSTSSVTAVTEEQLISARWTEGGGTINRSSALNAAGDVINYQVPSTAQHCSSLSDTITVSWETCVAGSNCDAGAPATNSVQVLVADPMELSPSRSSVSGAAGSTQTVSLSLSGGATPYSVTSSNGAAVSLSGGSLSYTIPASATADYSDTVTVQGASSGDQCGNNSATVVLNVEVLAEEVPLSASPADISVDALSPNGTPQEITRSFSVSGGTPPYVLSVDSVSGSLVGSVSPTMLTTAGSATYSVTIPADAPQDLQFENRILVTDSTGATTSIAVTANVSTTTPLSGRPDLTPNQASVARAVETVCPQLASMSNRTAAQDDLLTQCTNMLVNADSAGIPNTLEQITNSKVYGAKTAGIEAGTQQMANIGARLAALRAGSRGIDISALAINVDGNRISGKGLASLVSSGLSGGGASADQAGVFGPWGFFLNGSANIGNRDTTENETGFDYNSVGITGGVDYRFTDTFVAGAAFGYGASDVDYDTNGGGLDSSTWHLGAYATKSLTERLYIEGMVEFGWNDYDSTRNLAYQITSELDPVARRARADYKGNQFGATLGLGYDGNAGPVGYGFYGRVGYLDVTVDDIREKDAGGLNLLIDGFDATSVTTVLGAQISRAISTSSAVLVPQARVEWEHEYDDEAAIINARFAADPTRTTFQIHTDDPDRDYFRIGLGLAAVFPNGMSTFINYNTLLDKQDWTDHMIDAGLRFEF